MGTVRRILDLDPDVDARIEALAVEKGKDAAAVVAEAVALLDSIESADELDVEEDLRRLAEFEQTRMGVPWDEVKTWMESWGSPNELPPPKPRKL